MFPFKWYYYFYFKIFGPSWGPTNANKTKAKNKITKKGSHKLTEQSKYMGWRIAVTKTLTKVAEH